MLTGTARGPCCSELSSGAETVLSRQSRSALLQESDIDLFSNGQSIVDLDPKISDGPCDLRAAQQKLNGPQVPRPPINQGCLWCDGGSATAMPYCAAKKIRQSSEAVGSDFSELSRRLARQLTKSTRKGTCLAEAQRKCDFSHGVQVVGQQKLGAIEHHGVSQVAELRSISGELSVQRAHTDPLTLSDSA